MSNMKLCSVGSFFSGSLGDRFHAPTIVGIGLIGCGSAILLLAVGFWMNFIALNATASRIFFLVSKFSPHSYKSSILTTPLKLHTRILLKGVWILHGLMQSTGGPVNTVIMGNWFGPKNRGYIFGCWTCHQYVGNIIAAIIASVVLKFNLSWTWALLIPSVSNIMWGVSCIFFLPEKPESVGIEISETSSNPPYRKIYDRSQGVCDDTDYVFLSFLNGLNTLHFIINSPKYLPSIIFLLLLYRIPHPLLCSRQSESRTF